MSYAYWNNNRQNDHAVFEAFFRKNPFKGKFTIFAGLDEVIHFIKVFKFTDAHINYLKSAMPQCKPEYFEWLKNLDTSQVKVFGMRDGTLVFPREPLLRVEGPLVILQLLETPLLNLINFSSLISTNAARMKFLAGEDKSCIEFGLRRAQGPNGAVTASKYSYLGGFDGTSNDYAGYLYGIPIVGTHAHSFVMSFDSEEVIKDHKFLDGVDVLAEALKYRKELGWEHTELSELYAFVSYALNVIALVDSYSTLNSGVKNFICVYMVLYKLGYTKGKYGIRLDSGDLAYLASESKKLWNETAEKYGFDFSNLLVFASNDINEKMLRQLIDQHHKIDAFGIGTNLVTCQAQPALGMVYKLVEINGIPKIKLSDEVEKTSLPGKKKVFRIYEKVEQQIDKVKIQELPSFDVICLEEEDLIHQLTAQGSLKIWEPFKSKHIDITPARVQQLTEQLIDNGKPIIEKREACMTEFKQFGGALRLLNDDTNHDEYKVYLSDKLNTLLTETLDKLKFE